MNVELVRVDDRLIHGQILESWIPFLNAQAVMVANDELASDDFQRVIMSMAIPDRIKLSIVAVEEACKIRQDTGFKDLRTLVLVYSIKDAYRLFSTGFTYARLNIGNNKASSFSKQVSCSVWINEEEIKLIRLIMDYDVEIHMQSVPRERDIDMKSIIDMVRL